MKKIKYKMIEHGYMVTECPFQIGDYFTINKVGGWVCQECKYHVSQNTKEVTCCADETNINSDNKGLKMKTGKIIKYQLIGYQYAVVTDMRNQDKVSVEVDGESIVWSVKKYLESVGFSDLRLADIGGQYVFYTDDKERSIKE